MEKKIFHIYCMAVCFAAMIGIMFIGSICIGTFIDSLVSKAGPGAEFNGRELIHAATSLVFIAAIYVIHWRLAKKK